MCLLALQDEIVKIRAFIFKNWIMSKRSLFAFFEIAFCLLTSFLSVAILFEFANLTDNEKGERIYAYWCDCYGAIQVCPLDITYVLLYDIWGKFIKHDFIILTGIRHFF